MHIYLNNFWCQPDPRWLLWLINSSQHKMAITQMFFSYIFCPKIGSWYAHPQHTLWAATDFNKSLYKSLACKAVRDNYAFCDADGNGFCIVNVCTYAIEDAEWELSSEWSFFTLKLTQMILTTLMAVPESARCFTEDLLLFLYIIMGKKWHCYWTSFEN